ncbi:hypothetical protein [Jannaschia seohaensis]|nr:hypothetical protein [Jannaschia seohaensis]
MTAEDAPRSAAATERARVAAAASVARARTVTEEAPAEAPEDDDDRAPVPVVEDDVSAAIARTLREMASAPSEAGQADQPATPKRQSEGERRQARRDLLPDIEEINSSLRPDARALETAEPDDSEPVGEIPATRPGEGKSGFSLGFTAIMILVGIAVAIYLFATPLGEAVPQLDAPLSSYVATVDSGRIALEQRVDALAARILPEQ